MQFCKRCLYGESHPLGLVLDEFGICSGCRIHEEKKSLDWAYRLNRLKDLVKIYRSAQGNYDCVVPVTGAQDSYYTVWTVKERLGLKPLLVNYNSQWNTPLGIHNLANLRIKANSDLIQMNVNPKSVKRIVRTTLRRFGNINWHVLAGHTTHPVQVAIRKGIPLIIWGAHQGLEQVGMYSHLHEVEMSRHYRKMHDLFGFEADDLLEVSDVLVEDDIRQFRYPVDADILRVGVRGIYLGNFIPWDPSEQNRLMSRLWGFRSARLQRTFDVFDHTDSYVYAFTHDYLKLLKHGYSKVTDQATREIRHGRLTRTEALTLVRQHELANPAFIELLADWLGTNAASLGKVIDWQRSAKFWHGSPWGGWDFKGWSASSSLPNGSQELPTDKLSQLFPKTNEVSLGGSDEFIVIGKGWSRK